MKTLNRPTNSMFLVTKSVALFFFFVFISSRAMFNYYVWFKEGCDGAMLKKADGCVLKYRFHMMHSQMIALWVMRRKRLFLLTNDLYLLILLLRMSYRHERSLTIA